MTVTSWCTRCMSNGDHATQQHDAFLAAQSGPVPERVEVAWLTPAEHALVDKIGSLMGDFAEVMGEASTRRNDGFEVMLHVHGLQNMVLAQAAMRAYPGEYRGLGTTLREPEEPDGSVTT